MIETCRMCGQDGTPWSYVEELKGHICQECDMILMVVETAFDGFVIKLSTTPFDNGYAPDSAVVFSEVVSPRVAKKALMATVKKYCSKTYRKMESK